MIPGISGSLLSHDALERVIPSALRGRLGEAGRDEASRRLRAWHRRVRLRMGPSSSARAVFDEIAAPLAAQLGFRPIPVAAPAPGYKALLQAGGVSAGVMLVTPWGQDLSTIWREAVRQGIGYEVRWCVCVSGPGLRLADSQRTYSRRFVEFDLHLAAENDATFAVLWALLRADAVLKPAATEASVLEQAIGLSEQHRVSVRDSLQLGVEEALTRLTRAFMTARSRRRGQDGARAVSGGSASDESLIIIYRILFLLFAEARGLVPQWHPVFRDGYTIESLRHDVERLPRPRGLWEALQAISRLAHRGCHAGSLRVPPFNGRLFSPSHAPLADTVPLDDGAVREAVLALTTRPASAGTTRGRPSARSVATVRERIAYGDLGVEQLGGVYERLLDFTPPGDGGPPAAGRERRKATGSFYTPRALTEYLVRRTLAPLVDDATPDAILALRVVDPAMGSGAFLVAACRYLAGAYEAALIREGVATATDIREEDRAGFRRAVAQRCLYGVDVNPMAVQLGRLSLWLTTLAADKPLTFLDHRLRTGDSLIGASPWDVVRQPPPGRRARQRLAPLPLFEPAGLGSALGAVVTIRAGLAAGPGDTLEQVRAKERTLEQLEREDSVVRRWRQLAGAWCSGWFRDSGSRAELKAAFHSLMDLVLDGASSLPERTAARLLADADAIASDRRFFHWALEFPEVFYDGRGLPLASGGFDAVLGNPPWEMLRGDHGSARTRVDARVVASHVADFAHGAGVYRMQGDGHVNLYQLFVERALSLVRHEGRIGLILPSGLATDHGCAALRQGLLARTRIDTFHGFENREALFPIHRGLKFLLLTAQAGAPTTAIPGRFGSRRVDALERLPDVGIDRDAVPLARPFLERFSGSLLVVPEIRTKADLEIVTSTTFKVPALAHADGWRVTFGRELNATEDRPHFAEHGEGVPVIDGKHISPFAVDLARARFRIPFPAAAALLGAGHAYRRARLAYRDVASPTNRLTLIAAIIPADVVTTHTLFCAREPLDPELLLFLCGMLNSFVANYLVRLQVGNHVTASLMSRLPVPKPSRTEPGFRAIVNAAATLCTAPEDLTTTAVLQAEAARLYGLNRVQLAHILDGFPLINAAERAAVLERFHEVSP